MLKKCNLMNVYITFIWNVCCCEDYAI